MLTYGTFWKGAVPTGWTELSILSHCSDAFLLERRDGFLCFSLSFLMVSNVLILRLNPSILIKIVIRYESVEALGSTRKLSQKVQFLILDNWLSFIAHLPVLNANWARFDTLWLVLLLCYARRSIRIGANYLLIEHGIVRVGVLLHLLLGDHTDLPILAIRGEVSVLIYHAIALASELVHGVFGVQLEGWHVLVMWVWDLDAVAAIELLNSAWNIFVLTKVWRLLPLGIANH